MSKFKYMVTEFDNKTKSLMVKFDDGSYAKINLMVPLPENDEELEAIIKQYVLPQQAIDAQDAETDMSYVNAMIGKERECERRSLGPEAPKNQDNPNIGWDQDIPYNDGDDLDRMISDIESETLGDNAEFESAVMAVLAKNGMVKKNDCDCSEGSNCCKV